MIPYGKQSIDKDDIQAVVDVLCSDYLTTGPKVAEFEQTVADYVGTKHAVAVSSGTAALHCAMYALDIGPGDEVILPPMTFAATANSVVYQGGSPVFADVDPSSLLIDPNQVEAKITSKTKAIIGVDYAGHPCDWLSLQAIADQHRLGLVADSCHALGAKFKGKNIGSLADMTIFSFHPVKHITTGEGGIITTDNPEWADCIQTFRNHGITTDARQREKNGAWHYEMRDLGYNYRITDIQCALGLRQFQKLPKFLERRQEIAAKYYEMLRNSSRITPLDLCNGISLSDHAFHLFVAQLSAAKRNQIFKALRNRGIGVNVHYIPVHLHPYYQRKLGFKKGICPKAEFASEKIVSLPIWPGMTDADVEVSAQAILECAQWA